MMIPEPTTPEQENSAIFVTPFDRQKRLSPHHDPITVILPTLKASILPSVSDFSMFSP
jgi:hypothetical protein